MKDGNLESFEALLDDDYDWSNDAPNSDEKEGTQCVTAGDIILSSSHEDIEISLENMYNDHDFSLHEVLGVELRLAPGQDIPGVLDLAALPKVCACPECGLAPVFSVETRTDGDGVRKHYVCVRCGRSGDFVCPPPLSSGVMVAFKLENAQYALTRLIKGWNAACFGHVFVPRDLVCR